MTRGTCNLHILIVGGILYYGFLIFQDNDYIHFQTSVYSALILIELLLVVAICRSFRWKLVFAEVSCSFLLVILNIFLDSMSSFSHCFIIYSSRLFRPKLYLILALSRCHTFNYVYCRHSGICCTNFPVSLSASEFCQS